MQDETEAPTLTPQQLGRLDPVSLACTKEFVTDGWRDEHGRDLYDVLKAERGTDEALRIWRRAFDAFDERRGAYNEAEAAGICYACGMGYSCPRHDPRPSPHCP